MPLFMHIERVPGDATEIRHAGWIELESVRIDGQVITDKDADRGRWAALQPSTRGVSVLKSYDRASAPLLQAAATGAHLHKVLIEFVKGPGPGQPYARLELEDTLVSGIHPAPQAKTHIPLEWVELDFTKQTLTPVAT